MSINISAIYIAIAGFFLGRLLLMVKSIRLRIALVIGISYLIAFAFYWVVSLTEGVTAQHGSWASVFIGPLAIAGMLGTSVGLLVFSKLLGGENDT